MAVNCKWHLLAGTVCRDLGKVKTQKLYIVEDSVLSMEKDICKKPLDKTQKCNLTKELNKRIRKKMSLIP